MKAKRPSPRKFYGVPADRIPIPSNTLVATIEAIENECDGLPENDSYRARIEKLMAREYYDPDGRDEANHLRETRGGRSLEEMSRWAGFELGFEFHEFLHAGGKTKGAKK